MERSRRIEYSHEVNRSLHTVEGARAAFSVLLPQATSSLLDIGCGTGTWLKAALERGVGKVRGVEGLDLAEDMLFVDKSLIECRDLNCSVDLGDHFDLVLCLEVAQLIEPENADVLVDTITRHGDTVLFSAAVPGQGGIQHLNCQWPDYWQAKFNDRDYVCDDAPRWQIWTDRQIEPWYRQNLFQATRDPGNAGREPRVKSVIHPDALGSFAATFFPSHMRLLEQGGAPWRWYLSAPVRAAAAKVRAKLR